MVDLGIYYDNVNEASDTYLKYLIKDCEKNNISYEICHNAREWLSSTSKTELYLEPVLDPWIDSMKYNEHNVDIPSATAQGIYDYITKNCPDRSTTIAVIGRGLVGKQLIDKLIDYGYTVCEFNSKSNIYDMRDFCVYMTDIVVGLATEQLFDKNDCDVVLDNGAVFIDAANNFDTRNKLRCGKWTRDIIIDRIKERKE